jgi:hypothetical protein
MLTVTVRVAVGAGALIMGDGDVGRPNAREGGVQISMEVVVVVVVMASSSCLDSAGKRAEGVRASEVTSTMIAGVRPWQLLSKRQASSAMRSKPGPQLKAAGCQTSQHRKSIGLISQH